MTLTDVFDRRLRQQCLTGRTLRQPADVVAWFGAVQAQEYLPAKWALAQRTRGSVTDPAIEQAITRGQILRTHVLRPTWHFVTPADIRWMLALTGPRVMKAMASYSRQHGLDGPLVARAIGRIERVLAGGRAMTRDALGAELARAGITLKGIALALLTMHAEAEGIICSGPYEGRRLTYALLDERAPGARPLERDEAVAELVRRYFQSHGPATMRDFAWWSGLTMADGRRGIDILGGRRFEVTGLTYWTVGSVRPSRASFETVHLLPIYDEYTVAYRDRPWRAQASSTVRRRDASSVPFQHALVIDGQIAGTWRTARGADRMNVQVTPLRRLTTSERTGVAAAVDRYGQFLCTPAQLSR